MCGSAPILAISSQEVMKTSPQACCKCEDQLWMHVAPVFSQSAPPWWEEELVTSARSPAKANKK